MTKIEDTLQEFEFWLFELDETELCNSREKIIDFIKQALQKTREEKEERKRCTNCNTPFEPHHHRHITRDGIYHTGCYTGEKVKKIVEEEKKGIKKN